MKEPVLCYVQGEWAYFTTQPLEKQWGDDWNDAPYEHNAGRPYRYGEHDRKAGREPWEVVKVAWEGPFATPDEGHHNSPYSVEAINKGCLPWLRPYDWTQHQQVIVAGTPLSEFIAAVKSCGGKIYTEA